ncbi:NAD-dependent succinate-semialdehyde dehydrogenase [Aureibacillus halotolerans]|nr:NAD-dependent succinate-semialdehyde dehydrogenase [Aureibacillus halotolerans]
MQTSLFINGGWLEDTADKLTITNPATGDVIATVASASEKETQLAVDAAFNALNDWSKRPAKERSVLLKKLYHKMLEEQDEMAHLMTKEMGKPLEEAKGEVAYAASFVEWFAEEGRRVYGRSIPGGAEDQRFQVIKQPVGVVAAITPWNFPAAMITRKLAPALAAGCTIVIKPPSATPLTALMLAKQCQEVGIPNGVVNIVPASSKAFSNVIMKSDKVRKITFTGSTEVGKMLMKQAADTMKNLSLELGGHAPLLVFDDADVTRAVDQAVASKFRNAGQTCICANRIYVQAGVYDEFVDQFVKKVATLSLGNGLEGNDIGPLIDKDGFEKVVDQVNDAKEKGAVVSTGGEGYQDGGYYYMPTVLTNVDESMAIMHDETFGPVAPIRKFEEEDEAIRLANETPFGLAAYFFTKDVSRGTRVAEQLEYGIVGWNSGAPSAAEAPFGGMKESGIGREGGMEGIEAYLETKYISLKL